MLLYTMALTWIKKSDRYCWNNFSQSFIHPIKFIAQHTQI